MMYSSIILGTLFTGKYLNNFIFLYNMDYTLAVVAGVPVCQVLYTRHSSEIMKYYIQFFTLSRRNDVYDTQRCIYVFSDNTYNNSE